MRAKVVRQIRRLAYGKGHHPGQVQCFDHPKIPCMIIADEPRRRYQSLKRAFKQGKFTL
jgi:hypothetical protein